MTQLFIGSINTPNEWFRTTGEGVTVCELDEASGEFTRLASYPQVQSAMWTVKTREWLLVATERYQDGGEVGAFNHDFTRAGVAQRTSGGAICHLALSPDGKTLYTANYLGGVTVHALGTDGEIAKTHQVINYEGAGANPVRQEKSHPHQVVMSPDGRFVFVCDLGCDRIWIHPIEGDKLGPAQPLVVPPGSGPRHLVFHPRLPRFYLLGEIDAAVRIYEGRETDWRLVASHSALPTGFTGTPGGAAIRLHPCGKTLAVSVRGSDNIAVFRIDERGDLSLAANFPTLGQCPRDVDFTPSGQRLVVLNQDSDNAVAFGFDSTNGLPSGHVGAPFAIGCPMCVIF